MSTHADPVTSFQRIISLRTPNPSSEASSTPSSSASSRRLMSTKIDKYLSYPGKVEFKKKPVTDRIDYVVSSKKYRCMEIAKTKEKLSKRKQNNGKWVCVYCKVDFEEDERIESGTKWINCDLCTCKMHLSCIPISHRTANGLDVSSEEEIEFMCELCSLEN